MSLRRNSCRCEGIPAGQGHIHVQSSSKRSRGRPTPYPHHCRRRGRSTRTQGSPMSTLNSATRRWQLQPLRHLPPVDDDRCCRPWCWHGSDHLRSPCCRSRSCSAHGIYFSRRRGAAAANLLVRLVRWSVVHDAQVGLLHPLDDHFTCRGADARPHLRLDLPLLSCCCSNCCDCCCLLKPLCAHSWLACSCCIP